MIYTAYSVYDIHNGYSVPGMHDNDATAMRSFANVITDKRSLWYTHCADFYLDAIGTFDTVSGELVAEAPRRICSAADIVNMIDERGVVND